MDELDSGSTIRGFAPDTKVFNRYTLRRILGRGGMGVVWLARDEDLDRDVALKFLPEIVALDPASVADLKRETRRNLELTHPHIVRIYDFVQDARSAAISMEYVDGTSLSTLRLDRPHRVFPLDEVERLLGQLVDGLAYAHEKARIVHRDLKPANLMVNSRGELKITDFGIATSISDSVSRVSGQGSSGTAVYMSPQQMMGEKPSVTDDVYALGATVFELLTGKPPFYTGNIILQVTQKVPPTMAARREELGVTSSDVIPVTWEKAVAACLAKEPADRPASARAFLAMLQGKVVRGVPDADASVGASRGASAGVGRGVPDAASSPSPGTAQSDRDEGVPAPMISGPAPTVAKKPSAPIWIAAAAGAVVLLSAAGYFWLQSRDAGTVPPVTDNKSLASNDSPTNPATNAKGVDDTAKNPTPAQKTGTELTQAPVIKPVIQEAPKPQPATLRLTTDPADATVRMGDRTIPSPVNLTDLPAGPVELVVSREGFRDRRLQFELAAGQTLEVPVIRLEEILTPVTLQGRQDSLTYVIEGQGGRRYSGTLPDKLELSRGEYAVTANRPGYGEKRYDLVVRDQPVTFGADIPGAQIEITSTPAGATVRSGDKVLGQTPLKLEDQPPGRLPLSIGAQHFDTQSLTAELKGGETWSRSVQLSPDATTLALRDIAGYWMGAGALGALSDTAVHISAEERKLVMPGKALWRKAVLEATPVEFDAAAGGLVFSGKTGDWEGTFLMAREGEELMYWFAANPKQKWRFKRTSEEAYMKLYRNIVR